MMPSKPSRTKPKNKAKLANGWLDYSFEAIGTVWQVEVFEALDEQHAVAIKDTIAKLIGEFDKNYSRFRADSLVRQMAKQAGDYELPPDAQPMFELYSQLYDLTEGAMTPLIGNTLEQAGYDADYSFKTSKLTTPPAWDDVMTYQAPVLNLQQPALLDFGAVGKGHLVDLVGKLLEEHHAKNFCINAGGDMLYRTSNSQKLEIGLEHPADPAQAIGVATIRNQSLCGSSGNRRTWGKKQTFHHIINPQTLSSPKHIRALWTVADNTLLADALSTALFFVSAGKLQKDYTFEYAIIYDDDSLEHSADFPAIFFTNHDEA